MQGNLPHTPIAWMVVQEDFDDLVVATWGRGIWVLDDIAPLQQLTPAVLSGRTHLFDPRPAYLFELRRPTTTESFATEFDPPSHAGRNPPYGAPVTYYLGAVPSSEVKLTIVDEKGSTVQTLPGSRTVGLNRIWWDLRSQTRPTATDGQGGRGAGGTEPQGEGRGAANPRVTPGIYTVKLLVDGQEQSAKLIVRKDPNLN
jgi:hypothetical protein